MNNDVSSVPSQSVPQSTVNIETIANDVIATTVDYATTRTGLAQASIVQVVNLLKDYANTAVAVLGGVLTIATVAPYLAKTPILLYTGSAIMALGVILAYVIRRGLLDFLEKYLTAEYNLYHSIVDTARNVRREPGNQIYNDAFSKALQAKIALPHKNWFHKEGDKLAGALILVGIALVSCSLLLRVSI